MSKGDFVEFPEKRRSVRFCAEIPVLLPNGSGVTRDFSTDGAYFLTDQLKTPGEDIELFMLLDHTGGDNQVRLRCTGTVRRVEHLVNGTGVALAFTSQTLVVMDGKSTSSGALIT